MYFFKNDYSEGAHPLVLEALGKTNFTQTAGYGLDKHCEHAADLLRAACEAPQADVHFFVGGTQANLTVIAAALRPHQAVICAATGHVNMHETGAIEATGHKVLAAPTEDGKITPAQVEGIVLAHTDEHMVQPKLLYLSDATEVGSIYTLAELTALRRCCDAQGLYLFLDGARLANALCAEENDVSLPDLARLCDVFYLGGTKNGALFGEALLLCNDALKPDFRFLIKQHGGMMAKGRLLGVQFEALLTNGLYLENARHANEMALELKLALEECGFRLAVESPTNQQFVVMPDEALRRLERDFVFEAQAKPDAGHTEIRVCTSWATERAAVDALIAALRAL